MAAPVDPEQIPAQLVHLAKEAWNTAPQKRDGKPTRMRHALAAVIPAIREQVAREIEAEGMHRAARIARGEHTNPTTKEN